MDKLYIHYYYAPILSLSVILYCVRVKGPPVG